jgi:succinyl-diaminopimelate desuccinylase
VFGGGLGQEVRSEPPQLPPREPRHDEHSLRRVLPLLDRRAERIELVEPGAFVVGQEQADGLEPVGEPLGDAGAQLVEPLAAQRRDLEGVRVAVREASAAEGIDGVDLVEHELDGELVGADLAQDAVDGRDLLHEALLGLRRVDDVEDQVGDERLLERGGEPLDQLVGQPAHKADRVGDQIAAPLVLEAARGRVERLEEPVADGDAGVREGVQERRLAGVRVAGQGHGWGLGAAAFFAAHVTLAAQPAQALLQKRDAAPREAAVGLELRLAGAPRPDAGAEPAGAAAEALEVLPHPAHPRQVVFELRQLDLELSLGADGVLREDVEDQLRAVDDARLELVLERPLLRRAQLVVDEEHLGPGLSVRLLQLAELALADVRARIRVRPVLDDLGHRLDEGGARELLELRELVGGIDAGSEHREDEPALGLRDPRAIGLSHRHPVVIMTPAVPNPDLAARTLELVDVPSESRHEGAAMDLVRTLLRSEPLYDDGEAIVWGDRGAPVILAGHLDTVPAQDNLPGRISDGAVHGLGASDMKSGVAVMLELARAGAAARFVFFTREEVALAESPLPAVFASGVLQGAELAVVLEPTDCELHAGCLGNLQARVDFHGESAHSARPWSGRNAIHLLVEGLAPVATLEPHEVELDGLVYREVASAVRVEGGIAPNVVPAEASAELNVRYAPGRSPAEAEAWVRELLPNGELRVLHNSPAAPPALANPHVERLRELVPQMAPKQAWTPVAQFAERGIDAINYGPGATAFAHRVDEQVPIANLHTAYDTLARFLS